MKSSPSRYALASLAAGEAAEFAQSRGEIGPREGQGGGRVRGGGGGARNSPHLCNEIPSLHLPPEGVQPPCPPHRLGAENSRERRGVRLRASPATTAYAVVAAATRQMYS